jgi:hypothetical protein
MIQEHARNHDHAVKIDEALIVTPLTTISTWISNVAGALQRPKVMTMNWHSPWPVENASSIYRHSASPLANNRTSKAVWITIWFWRAAVISWCRLLLGSRTKFWHSIRLPFVTPTYIVGFFLRFLQGSFLEVVGQPTAPVRMLWENSSS